MDEPVVSFGAEMVNGGRNVALPVEGERFVAYAVDIASRFALSMVIDRSERPWVRWLQCWRREGAAWVLASASPDPVGSGVLGARVGVGEPTLVRVGSGALLLRSGRWPWSGQYGCWKDFQASGDVATVVIDDRPVRHVEVPWHGRVIVGWHAPQRIDGIGPGFGLSAGPSRRSPTVQGLSGTGRTIGPAD